MSRSSLDKLRAETTEIRDQLAERIGEVVPFLFPAGKRIGDRWLVGDKFGAPGDELAISLTGPWKGWGYHFKSRKGTNLWDLWTCARRVPFKEAREEAETFLSNGYLSRTIPPLKHGIELLRSGYTSWPPEIMAEYYGGQALLAGDEILQAEIAAQQGWTIHFVAMLVRWGWISMPTPKYVSGPVLVFPVGGPMGDKGEFIWMGYHGCRWPDATGWLYRPSLETHGLTIAKTPYILGDLKTARTIILVNGELDALSLIHHFDWWDLANLKLPKNICVVGIRGATAWEFFIPTFLGNWSREAHALLLAESEATMSYWRIGFIKALRTTCGSVTTLLLNDHRDWNSALRSEGDASIERLSAALAQLEHGRQ